jgi:hypothetical protein
LAYRCGKKACLRPAVGLMARRIAAIKHRMYRTGVASLIVALSAPVQVASATAAFAGPHDALIARHAAANSVPEALVRRIIRIESRGNPRAVHAGNYGLMQIRLGTARGMGYTGSARGLLDPDTNLTYAVKYLAGAWRAAGCRSDRAVRYYQRGYYGVRHSKCGVADVLKPRAVQIETSGAGGMMVPRARPPGRFEPARISAERMSPQGERRIAAIPLPPVRRGFETAPEAKHMPRTAHRHSGAKAKIKDKIKARDSSDPIGVVAFVKKMVTPEKPSRRRAAATDMPPPGPPPPM